MASFTFEYAVKIYSAPTLLEARTLDNMQRIRSPPITTHVVGRFHPFYRPRRPLGRVEV
jgi:hypothetical protein